MHHPRVTLALAGLTCVRAAFARLLATVLVHIIFGIGLASTSAQQGLRLENRAREACLRRLELTDFAEERFASSWMSEGNLTAFLDCLYHLRTKLRPRKKAVHAGGVHYPTLIVTNHRHPVVSTSGASWCWLDKRAVNSNGLNPSACCDQQHGPRGLEACWDKHFTFDLCCQGNLDVGELPHFFSVPALDINVGNTLKRRGTFDQRMSYALQSLCRPGYTVLDVGANLGAFTVPLAERVGRRGVVHAFEPFRKVFQHLNANVAMNGLSNVYTYNIAVGRDEREVEVHSPDLSTFTVPSAMRVENQHGRDDAAMYDKVFYEEDRARISMRPLDSFDFGGRPVHFVKIDVEFMELEVILGARELIRKHRPVIWAENEPFFKKKPPDTQFVDTMATEFGYQCQAVADLELLCTPPEKTDEVVVAIGNAMQHLNMPLHHLSLGRVISAVDPGFASHTR